MTWTTPNNVSTGVASSSQFNTETVANLQHLYDLIHDRSSYTPTVNNWTVGNGTVTGSYQALGKWLWVRGILTLGTTSTMSGALNMSLPSGFSCVSGQKQTIGAVYTDLSASSAVYVGGAYAGAAGQTLQFKTMGASGNTNVTSSAPFTWADGDTVEFAGWVEVN